MPNTSPGVFFFLNFIQRVPGVPLFLQGLLNLLHQTVPRENFMIFNNGTGTSTNES